MIGPPCSTREWAILMGHRSPPSLWRSSRAGGPRSAAWSCCRCRCWSLPRPRRRPSRSCCWGSSSWSSPRPEASQPRGGGGRAARRRGQRRGQRRGRPVMILAITLLLHCCWHVTLLLHCHSHTLHCCCYWHCWNDVVVTLLSHVTLLLHWGMGIYIVRAGHMRFRSFFHIF